MNTATTGRLRLVIGGATGMVGGYALRYALDHPAVARVTATGRKKPGISHPGLNEVLHRRPGSASERDYKRWPITPVLTHGVDFARAPRIMTTMSNPNLVSDSRSVPEQSVTHFTNVDVGSPQIAGSATPVGSGWDVIAGGADIWENADQFHFVFREISGDFDIAVRVESFTPAHLYSKTGLMIRESLGAASAHVMFFVFSDDEPRNNNLGAYEMQFRPRPEDSCQAIYPAVRPPAPPEFPAAYPNSWLRVARRGNQFSAYASTDGETWKLYGEKVLTLASTLKVGPALTSHNPETAAKASFRDYVESERAL
jgi:hypothetical protein